MIVKVVRIFVLKYCFYFKGELRTASISPFKRVILHYVENSRVSYKHTPDFFNKMGPKQQTVFDFGLERLDHEQQYCHMNSPSVR